MQERGAMQNMIKNKIILFLLLCISIFCIPVYGNGLEQKNINIVFAVDCSNSMNFNDKQNLSGELIKLFTDSVFENTNIGLVLYDDTILESIPLGSVSDKTAVKNIQQKVQSMIRKGNTDIGLALKETVNLLPEGEQQQNVIILFSDGETDLKASKTGRTMQQSYADESYACIKANQTNTNIFTIGLSKTGNLDTSYLQKIAAQTGGKSYTLQHSNQLSELFQNMYQDITKSNVNVIDNFSGSGNYQKQVNMINGFADSSDIVIHTQYGIKDITTDCKNSTITYSENYAVIKVEEPSQDIVNIQFNIPQNDNITVQTIHHITVLPKIEQIQNNALLHLPITVKLYQTDTRETVTSKKLYENMTGELLVTDIKTGEKQKITMGNAGNELLASFKNSNPKTYRFEATVKNGLYQRKTVPYNIELSNTLPYITEKNEINLLQKKETQQIDLNQYFKDNDGDTLVYQTENTDCSIDKNILLINTRKEQQKQVNLYVSDGRGGVITEMLTFHILPFWIYYKNVVFIILLLFIALLLFYFLVIKKHPQSKQEIQQEQPIFSGKTIFSNAAFEGYFLNTLSGNEIPVLNWNASYINNKKSVTLGELFHILDVTEKLPEAHKISIEAGKNETVQFYHNTNCVITCKKRNIFKRKKETLQYEDKVHIIFEDTVTEMELYYKRKQKKY